MPVQPGTAWQPNDVPALAAQYCAFRCPRRGQRQNAAQLLWRHPAGCAIGAFFATPYMIPSQISAMEFKITGKDHTAMYFAVQALTTSAVGAVSTGLIYEYVKNIQVQKVIEGAEIAGETWKIGVSLIPFFVSVMCIIGFFTCFKLPKHYTEDIVRKDLEKSNIK